MQSPPSSAGLGVHTAGLEPSRRTLKVNGSVKIIVAILVEINMKEEEVRKKYADPERRLCKVHMDGHEEKNMHLTKSEIVALRHAGYTVKEL